jgi:1-acyl-sn-glycerol-3-phosphate acyltransferase
VEVVRHVSDLSGPVMFVGNHPNSLIDPALVFVITDRQVTFLAREPLFHAPVLGWLLKGLGALPVFRKQDHPGLMEKNEGTLEAAATALAEGRAITIFPEGKSHSAPQLSDIKTGCARIALRVARKGTALRVVPIGLTYAQKHRFRSRVHLEVGEPLLVPALAEGEAGSEAEVEWVQSLTRRVGEALRNLTLNLETWEDLELIETADQLFALRNGYREQDPERLRMIATGAGLLRNVDPERFDEVKEDVLSYRARLETLRADPKDLSVSYQHKSVTRFVFRNLGALVLGFPLFALGMALFAAPFLLVKLVSTLVPVARDRRATLKFVSALVMVPVWWTVLSAAGWAVWGTPGLLLAMFGALPLAMFTRYFLERRKAAWDDLIAFARLGSRARLREHLLAEGDRLSDEIQRLAEEFRERVEEARAGGSSGEPLRRA